MAVGLVFDVLAAERRFCEGLFCRVARLFVFDCRDDAGGLLAALVEPAPRCFARPEPFARLVVGRFVVPCVFVFRAFVRVVFRARFSSSRVFSDARARETTSLKFIFGSTPSIALSMGLQWRQTIIRVSRATSTVGSGPLRAAVEMRKTSGMEIAPKGR